jgi:hypothetical protein
VIGKKIEAAGKKYCEKHKIDLLLVQSAGSQFNYINPTMDVTKEFIAFLNQEQELIEKDITGKIDPTSFSHEALSDFPVHNGDFWGTFPTCRSLSSRRSSCCW